MLGEQSEAWVVFRILKLELVKVKVGACQCLVCSIIAAAQCLYIDSTVNSSSVGMVGISCLCGLVLEEEHAGVK